MAGELSPGAPVGPPGLRAARARLLDTARGALRLCGPCDTALVDELRPSPGLDAFTGDVHEEYALLRDLVADSQISVTVARRECGTIAGLCWLRPGTGWWAGLPGLFEFTLETNRCWRRLGVARAMMAAALDPSWIEHAIVLAIGLSWHWDLSGTGLDEVGYRDLVKALLLPFRFREVRTSEPNIAMRPTNVLMVRIGEQVSAEAAAAFREARYIAPPERLAGRR